MNHFANCQCLFCKCMRGEVTGKNHPTYGNKTASWKGEPKVLREKLLSLREKQFENGKENIDFIICKECGTKFEEITHTHLKSHHCSGKCRDIKDYKQLHPDSQTICKKRRKLLGKKSKGHTMSLTGRKSLSIFMKHNNPMFNPEVVQRLRESCRIATKKLWQNPEYRENVHKSLLAKWQDPEFRAKMEELHNTPEIKAKKREVALKFIAENPDFSDLSSKRMIETIKKWEKRNPEEYYNHQVKAGQAPKPKGSNHGNWNGGSVPSYGYNINEQNQLAMERANYKCEVTGLTQDETILNVHHKISVRDCHLRFMEICYPSLYTIMIGNGHPLFGLFEQSIRKGHKNWIHYKGIPLNSIFSNCFYDEMNSLDNLKVLCRSEHIRIHWENECS